MQRHKVWNSYPRVLFLHEAFGERVAGTARLCFLGPAANQKESWLCVPKNYITFIFRLDCNSISKLILLGRQQRIWKKLSHCFTAAQLREKEKNFNLRWYHCVVPERDKRISPRAESGPAMKTRVYVCALCPKRLCTHTHTKSGVQRERRERKLFPQLGSVQKGLENTCAPRVCIINMLWNAAFCFCYCYMGRCWHQFKQHRPVHQH